jgi:hypothetical protein
VTGLILPFTVTLAVTANSDYGEASDVQSIVNNAFYQVTGQMPTSQIVGTTAPGATLPALQIDASGNPVAMTAAPVAESTSGSSLLLFGIVLAALIGAELIERI